MDEELADPAFTGAWLKWGQGVVHSQTLEVQVESFSEAARHQPLLTHRTEYHSDRHGFAVLVDSVLVPIPVRWGLLVGDIANNFRSALDHVAWALTARGKRPPDKLSGNKRRHIGFPIKRVRTEFNGELCSMLPGVSRADIAKVRACQPYLAGTRAAPWHPLSMLAGINNAHKHQGIQPILDIPDSARYEITNVRDCTISKIGSYVTMAPLKVDTEVAFIRARKTGPNPQIDVEPFAIAQPALERVWLRDWLDLTEAAVFAVLVEFSTPPEELGELGIDWETFSIDLGNFHFPPNH